MVSLGSKGGPGFFTSRLGDADGAFHGLADLVQEGVAGLHGLSPIKILNLPIWGVLRLF